MTMDDHDRYQEQQEQLQIEKGAEARIEEYLQLESHLRHTIAIVTEYRIEMSVAAAAMLDFARAFYGDECDDDDPVTTTEDAF